MTRPIKPAVGQVWYDPRNDTLGLVDAVSDKTAYVAIEFGASELFVVLSLSRVWTEHLVYIGKIS